MTGHTIHVTLPAHGYPIYLGARTLPELGAACRTHDVPRRVVVLADRNSAAAGLRTALASLTREGFEVSSLVFPPGEKQKSMTRANAILSWMLKEQLSRNSALIALGGGVVGDVGGFSASTYRRGITFIQCPTTLLSQVDSSVGGKNGVNHARGKNAIGTYLQPRFVFTDVALLASLPRREVIAGLGEILKYPIVSDPAMLGYIEENLDRLIALDRGTVMHVAQQCLSIKAALVSEDERELFSDHGRVFLNVGHAVGHALETLSHYRLRHGEAVLLGILAEGYIAVQREGFPQGDLERFVKIYRRLGKRYDISNIPNGAILKFVQGKGHARFVLPRAMGEVAVVSNVSEEQLRGGLAFLREVC